VKKKSSVGISLGETLIRREIPYPGELGGAFLASDLESAMQADSGPQGNTPKHQGAWISGRGVAKGETKLEAGEPGREKKDGSGLCLENTDFAFPLKLTGRGKGAGSGITLRGAFQF